MTTTDPYRSERNWFIRAAVWWGHRSITLQTPSTVLVWSLIVVNWWADEQIDRLGVVYALVLVAAVLIHISLLLGEMAHEKWLCWRDVASATVLLDPQTAVEKNRNTLAFAHKRKAQLVYTAGLAPVVLIGFRVHNWPMPGRVAATVAAVVGVGCVLYLNHVSRTHRRLQPWCPFCRGGRGDTDTTPAPTPTPAGHSTR